MAFGSLSKKDLREPKGALQIPPLLRSSGRDGKGGEAWLRLELLAEGETRVAVV